MNYSQAILRWKKIKLMKILIKIDSYLRKRILRWKKWCVRSLDYIYVFTNISGGSDYVSSFVELHCSIICCRIFLLSSPKFSRNGIFFFRLLYFFRVENVQLGCLWIYMYTREAFIFVKKKWKRSGNFFFNNICEKRCRIT